VVNRDMKVEMRTVKLGLQVEQNIIVESGLRAGDLVVTEGQIRLTPGRRVTIQDSKSAESKSGTGS